MENSENEQSMMLHPHQAHIKNEKTGRIQTFTVYEEGTSMTNQQWKDDCDINKIVKRYGEDQIPQKQMSGVFMDWTGIPDYPTMLQTVKQAGEKFMELPALVRARFENDPAQLLSFLNDSNNRQEAEYLGLIEKQKPELTMDNSENVNANKNSKQNAINKQTKNQKQSTEQIESD